MSGGAIGMDTFIHSLVFGHVVVVKLKFEIEDLRGLQVKVVSTEATHQVVLTFWLGLLCVWFLGETHVVGRLVNVEHLTYFRLFHHHLTWILAHLKIFISPHIWINLKIKIVIFSFNFLFCIRVHRSAKVIFYE